MGANERPSGLEFLGSRFLRHYSEQSLVVEPHTRVSGVMDRQDVVLAAG